MSALLLKRSKYTCGKVIFDPQTSARLVHMNDPSKVVAYLPEIKHKSDFDHDCLYGAFIDPNRIHKLPPARIHQNLGPLNCPLTQLKAHLMYCGLNHHVLCDSKHTTTQIDLWEPQMANLNGRRSFLDDCVITIDPESAADFDDALSIKKNDDNSYQVIDTQYLT